MVYLNYQPMLWINKLLTLKDFKMVWILLSKENPENQITKNVKLNNLSKRKMKIIFFKNYNATYIFYSKMVMILHKMWLELKIKKGIIYQLVELSNISIKNIKICKIKF